MPVGTVSGEPVLKLLISSVAANTQALEHQTTVAKDQTTARASKANSMEKLNPTHSATGGPAMPVGPVTGETVFELLMSSDAANPQAHETTWTEPAQHLSD